MKVIGYVFMKRLIIMKNSKNMLLKQSLQLKFSGKFLVRGGKIELMTE